MSLFRPEFRTIVWGELAKELILEFKLKDIEVIYHAALEKGAGPERSEYLDSTCGGDIPLREHIEALLKANEQAADFLENPGFGVDIILDESPLSEGPGTVIGRYKLLGKIGEGGMAVVYMAEQEKPIRRKVALKIIKLGMDTKSVIARFEAERQALAMMDYPNIAKILAISLRRYHRSVSWQPLLRRMAWNVTMALSYLVDMDGKISGA